MSTTLTPADILATFAWSTKPATEYLGASKTKVRIDSGEAEAFVWFGIKTGSEQVISATLEWPIVGASDAAKTATLQRHDKPRRPYKGMNWQNRPGVLAGSSPVTASMGGASLVFDVTADVAAIRAGGGWYGWRLTTNDTTARFLGGFRSSSKPVLRIELADPAPIPVGLSPAGGPVASTKPLVSWPSLSCQNLRVQFDEAGGDFSTPTWDSGEVVAAASQLDLSTTSFPGLSGTHVQWRAKQDGSDWSAPVEVWYTALPTATLTPSGTVTDPTPTHTLTMTGLVGYIAELRTVDGRTVERRGYTPASGGTDSWAFETGAASDGAVMTTVVQAYTSTAYVGSVRFREVSSTWELSLVGATAAPSRVAAAQLRDAPLVRVTIEDAASPDEILVTRWPTSGPDQARIVARFAADENVQSAGVWAWTDATCPPNTKVTYAAQTIKAGVLSLPHHATIVTEVTGLWLWDEPTGRHVCLSNAGVGNLALATSAATYTTVAGLEYTVTYGLAGISGDLSGSFSGSDRDARAMKADALWIRQHPEREYRLIVADINVPVAVSRVSSLASEWAMTDRMHYDFAAHVAQVGEFDES